MRASTSSRPSGSGCSTSATPACAQASRLAARLASLQPSLASTINVVFGAAARTAAMRAGSPSAPSLILSRARCAARSAACAMTVGFSERNRVGGRDWSAVRAARPARTRAVRRAWPRDPRTRNRAHCARRRPALRVAKPARSRPCCELRPHRLERGGDALDGFAIACIGHAFAAASHIAIREFRNDNGGLRLGAAADRERAGDRPALDGVGKHQGRVHGQSRGDERMFRQTLDRFIWLGQV